MSLSVVFNNLIGLLADALPWSRGRFLGFLILLIIDMVSQSGGAFG